MSCLNANLKSAILLDHTMNKNFQRRDSAQERDWAIAPTTNEYH